MSNFRLRLTDAEANGGAIDGLQLLHAAKREPKHMHPDPIHWTSLLYIDSPEERNIPRQSLNGESSGEAR